MRLDKDYNVPLNVAFKTSSQRFKALIFIHRQIDVRVVCVSPCIHKRGQVAAVVNGDATVSAIMHGCVDGVVLSYKELLEIGICQINVSDVFVSHILPSILLRV